MTYDKAQWERVCEHLLKNWTPGQSITWANRRGFGCIPQGSFCTTHERAFPHDIPCPEPTPALLADVLEKLCERRVLEIGRGKPRADGRVYFVDFRGTVYRSANFWDNVIAAAASLCKEGGA